MNGRVVTIKNASLDNSTMPPEVTTYEIDYYILDVCATSVCGNQLQWLQIVLTKLVRCGSTFIESWNKQRLFGECEELAEIVTALSKSLKICLRHDHSSVISDSSGQTMRTIVFCG